MTGGKIAAGAALVMTGVLGVWLVIGRQQIRQEEKAETTDIKNVNEIITNNDIMQLTSTVFTNNGAIPAKYTCDGEDVNPPLTIAGVPAGTQSLVLIVDDPDVPKSIREDGMWDHWIVFNIPPDTTEISAGMEPAGVHGKGTNGDTGYHGPCPPDGQHRYFFKLYALDTVLNLGEGAGKAGVEQAMTGHILEQTELIGLYERA